MRQRFVAARFRYKPETSELKDLTHFAHGEPARVLACENCGLLVREEESLFNYARDRYDLSLLEHLYPRYVSAFARKGNAYRDLLPPRADVLELGSHLGAFLEVAEGWHWNARGLEIGKQTHEFARRKGLTVHRWALADCPESQRADALFIWNCFEQLEDPEATLRDAYLRLKRHGLLVVRVPNGAFYRRWRGRDHPRMAYNNLMAFPYLYGYSPDSPVQLISRQGFESVSGHDSTLLTIPFPEMTPQLEREWSRVRRLVSEEKEQPPRTLSGPWIEVVFRRREM